MVNLDTVVLVGISTSAVGMSAVGIKITINPPGDRKWLKWLYSLIFIALGIIFIGFGFWQNDRAEREKKREADNRIQEQLTNEGNQRYMRGQLDSQSKMLGILIDNSDPKHLANAMRAFLKQTPTQSNLSNAQVKDAAHALTQKLRQLQQQISHESEALYSNLDNLAQAPITTPDIESSMMSVAGEGRRKLAELSAKNETRFGQVREDCINMVGLLQYRTPQPLPMPNETVSKALFGSLTGPNPVGEVADYIDQLANRVPVTR